MKKFTYLLLSVAMMTSCSESFVIQGTSSVTRLDGSKLYLKIIKDKELADLDSCEVVHGKFHFSGALDTVQMASLFMGAQSLMPLVVEKGDISVTIDNGKQKVGGSPLNDLLYSFLDKHTQLQNQMEELDHRYSQMLLDGIGEDEIDKVLSAEAAVIAQKEDSLVSDFVERNFCNLLAPFVFVNMASSIPQVEHIMSKAPDTFKNNPLVADFYKSVTESETMEKPVLQEPAQSSEIDDATIQDILNGNENAN